MIVHCHVECVTVQTVRDRVSAFFWFLGRSSFLRWNDDLSYWNLGLRREGERKREKDEGEGWSE